MMNSKMTWILSGLTAFLGATYAFGDGIMNDADTIRAQGGVGNFLFYDQYQHKDKVTADTTAVDNDRDALIENQDEGTTDAYYDSSYDNDNYTYDDSEDSLNLGASSAGRAR